MGGQIQLRVDPKTGKYTRFTKQLRIKLFAKTHKTGGDCVLCEAGELYGGQRQGTKRDDDKHILKRLSSESDWRKEYPSAIKKELGLEEEWQRRHIMFMKHVNVQERHTAYKYPGLQTIYVRGGAASD